MLSPKQLPANIKTFRRAKGLTQTDLAALLQLSPQSVSKWESGQTAPDIENLCLIAKALDVSLDALLSAAEPERKALIGIDGGGSKTEFVMFTQEGDLLDRLILGACNPNAVGIQESAQLIKSGIDALVSIHGPVWGVFVGASGFLTGGNGKKIQEILARAYPQTRVFCETDIMNVIASATEADHCAAVICGTGSIVYAKEGERLTRLSGWGYLLSESGSGYDIGRGALQAALADEEGLGDKTVITKLVQRKLDASVSDCIRQVYLHDQSYIAAFAPLVFEAYAAGDAVAAGILKKNAAGLARVINYTVDRYCCDRRVILSGGLLTGNETFAVMVRQNLASDLKVEIPAVPQVIGACRLCAKACGVSFNAADKRLLAQYLKRG